MLLTDVMRLNDHYENTMTLREHSATDLNHAKMNLQLINGIFFFFFDQLINGIFSMESFLRKSKGKMEVASTLTLPHLGSSLSLLGV